MEIVSKNVLHVCTVQMNKTMLEGFGLESAVITSNNSKTGQKRGEWDQEMAPGFQQSMCTTRRKFHF